MWLKSAVHVAKDTRKGTKHDLAESFIGRVADHEVKDLAPPSSSQIKAAEAALAGAVGYSLFFSLLYDVSAMPIDGGPYLAAAFLCEKALREVDGVNSFIRVVDRWTITGPTEEMPQTAIQATLVVMFKSGIHRGPGRLVITPTSPQDQRMQAIEIPLLFEGDEDRGVAIAVPMAFPVQEPGVYWFDVSLDGQSFSHIPLRVVYHRVVATPMPPNPTGDRPPQH
jgi:hypothetical protein